MKIYLQSEKQWVISFLLYDVAVWCIVGAGCVFSFVSCGESSLMVPAVLYAPFFAFFPSSSGWASIIYATILGVLTHILLGAIVGRITRGKSVDWTVSAVASLFILLVLFGITVLFSAR